MIRILVADDHSLIRAGLKQILAEKSNTDVIEACDSKEVFVQLKKFDVNIVVLDISLPGKNGIEILKDIKLSYPHISVLMLSVYPEEQYGIRALKAGASGYLTKDSAPENLALLRRLALNILRSHPDPASIRRKIKRAGWDNAFLLAVLGHMR